ncbi:type I restriction enzyme, M subunit [Spiroplasma helicoides]|uniref:site-specific DNA-methyltransferase (adenine-specific) n=1 Tax=Spiroplasma helicoides TaxID=216938 RepID=A0A1B3SKC2_9MOLU|nr:class I SAM-dependent DNA methyltransferase [Spiroplasma helicoides]AOG60382.1 type I restriction enzyme, M subunit [Spiroplasma helicoides]
MAKNIQDIETKLWNAADTLRGNMSAEEYMHTILGILSLKYISDRNKVGLKNLIKDGLSLDLIKPDEFYYQYNAFIVPNESNWNYIMSYANDSKIGEVLDNAFLRLEESNSMLQGIFNKNYNKEGVDQVRLGEVIKIFSDEDFSDDDEDIIGRIYEYFLGKFFRDRGQSGGEFYTPTSIVQLMVNLISPTKGTIYDPACGSGGILVQSKKYIESHGGKLEDITVYGQEFNNVTWKLAKLNLVLNGFPLLDTEQNGVLGQRSADTFTDDQHKNKLFDFIMANPPFNMKKWGQDKLLEDPRFKWGIPPANNANYAWLSHIISKLNTNGRAATVLANGSLSSTTGNEKLIREEFVKQNKVDAIIELPDKLFYTTGIPACIWVFNNNKKNDNILMVSAQNFEGNMISKKLRELTIEEIKNVADFYNMHLNGEDVEELGLAKTISSQELSENDYSFVPGRYVGTKEKSIDKKQIKEDIQSLSKELFSLMDELEEITPKIKDSIKKAFDFEED